MNVRVAQFRTEGLVESYGGTTAPHCLDILHPAVSAIPHGKIAVAVTAHAMVGDRENAIAAGCADCLTKPYELEQLIALVERYVGPAETQPKVA